MDTETRKPITVYYYGEVVADCVAEFKNNQVNPIILSKIADLFLFVQVCARPSAVPRCKLSHLK